MRSEKVFKKSEQILWNINKFKQKTFFISNVKMQHIKKLKYKINNQLNKNSITHKKKI